MIVDPAATRVAVDLLDADFVSGEQSGYWRIVNFSFPTLDFAIAAVEPNGEPSEYGFRADLSNYPATAPWVRIWDHAKDELLEPGKRPKGNHRTTISFQPWQEQSVYRPWDRHSGPHDLSAANNRHLAWHPERRLSFIFRDLHGILTSNALASGLRASS